MRVAFWLSTDGIPERAPWPPMSGVVYDCVLSPACVKGAADGQWRREPGRERSSEANSEVVVYAFKLHAAVVEPRILNGEYFKLATQAINFLLGGEA